MNAKAYKYMQRGCKTVEELQEANSEDWFWIELPTALMHEFESTLGLGVVGIFEKRQPTTEAYIVLKFEVMN